MLQRQTRVLLIDDDEDYFFITRDLLADVDGWAYQVVWIPSLTVAHDALANQDYDVCLVDYHLGRENGLEFVRSAKDAGIEVPMILLTGQGDRNIDLEAMAMGAADYLNKGELSAGLLERTIRYAIERARHLSQLREYASDLEMKNRELDAYTHTIAHDLTNPLNLVTGFVGLTIMKDGSRLSAESLEMLRTVENQAVKMADMVTQLLWMAQLRDASEVTSVLEIEPIAKAAVSRFVDRIQAQAVNVHIVDDMPMALGQTIWVEEIFANLLSNALKYMGADNSNPQITIRGFKQDHFAIFEVEDNGIGIAPEDQKRLFEMFGRIRNKQTQDIQGLGLGLSIVHRIVTKLGGVVGVRSVLNEGSVFWFSLPLSRDSN